MQVGKRTLNGMLAVIKPAGVTSFDVVHDVRAVLKRGWKLRKLKVGHGGTLDKEATGVLVLGVGHGCKQLQGLLSGPKTYSATARLGSMTDTYDVHGEVLETSKADHVTETLLQTAIGQFVGDIMQQPPAYSSIKRGGKRLRDYAEKGLEVPKVLRAVRVDSLSGQLLNTSEQAAPVDFKLRVQCGGGTYVRSLIHDIGLACGTHAHMLTLNRDAHGPFTHGLEKQQWSFANLCEAIQPCDEDLDKEQGEN